MENSRNDALAVNVASHHTLTALARAPAKNKPPGQGSRGSRPFDLISAERPQGRTPLTAPSDKRTPQKTHVRQTHGMSWKLPAPATRMRPEPPDYHLPIPLLRGLTSRRKQNHRSTNQPRSESVDSLPPPPRLRARRAAPQASGT